MSIFNRAFSKLPKEFQDILSATLPSQAFQMLVELCDKEVLTELSELDISRSDSDFKAVYITLSNQRQQLKDLLAFINKINRQKVN